MSSAVAFFVGVMVGALVGLIIASVLSINSQREYEERMRHFYYDEHEGKEKIDKKGDE